MRSLGTVRRLPSAAAAVAVPPAASTDLLLHAVSPKPPAPQSGSAAPLRAPALRPTVYVHRIIPMADVLLQQQGLQQLLQHLLQQLEAAFRDPHVHPTSSSTIVLQLLQQQTPARQAALQQALFEALQLLKEGEDGERLLRLNVEKVELRVPQEAAAAAGAAAASGPAAASQQQQQQQQQQQLVIRASSRGGCWLEPEQVTVPGGAAGYDGECDLHASAAARLKQQQQQQQQHPLAPEASTAESSAAPSPLLSELFTPEGGSIREGEGGSAAAAGSSSSSSGGSSIHRSSSCTNERLPFSWGRGGTAAAAAEAERTAPLIPLKGITEEQLAAKRAAAQRAGSTYIYDFLGLINAELQQQWRRSQEALAASGDTRKLVVPNKLLEVCS